MPKLNLGCGPTHYEGEIGVDLYKTAACAVQANINNLPFADDSVDFVRLDHVLEHMPIRECPLVILEAYRTLCTGGIVKIGVPDLVGTFQTYLDHDRNIPNIAEKLLLLRTIYGSQNHPGEYHKSGWDVQTLTDLLTSVGFHDINSEQEQRMEGICISVTGIK